MRRSRRRRGQPSTRPRPRENVSQHPVTVPAVSVIVPVWNVEPYLAQCLDSVVAQSIGLDRIELIAVDDGSTDGSAGLLDEYAARHPQLRVIHQPNSGGPGKPRNAGLDVATGRYVFFLDADDYLGPEALERLVAMADRNRSDVVLAKLVGIDGRNVPSSAFRRTLRRAPLETVYSTLTVLKLFRRAHLERIGARFAEGLGGGEDAPFTQLAYLTAGVISVLGDYDAYYCRRRPGSQSRSPELRDLLDHLRRMEGRIELLVAHVPAGKRRDRMMGRHIAGLARTFSPRWAQLDPAVRGEVFETAVPMIRRWSTPGVERHTPQWVRIRTWCLANGRFEELRDIVAVRPAQVLSDPIADGRRVYAAFPHFRDGTGIPDDRFDITREIVPSHGRTRGWFADGLAHVQGQAYLHMAPGRATVLLTRIPFGPTLEVPTEVIDGPPQRDRYLEHPDASFLAVFDPATARGGSPLERGRYEVRLRIGE